jgi:hypothetical protein
MNSFDLIYLSVDRLLQLLIHEGNWWDAHTYEQDCRQQPPYFPR